MDVWTKIEEAISKCYKVIDLKQKGYRRTNM